MSSDKDAAGGFQFPACWSDDVRMGALFAQPRSENVNPQVSECFEGVGLLFCLFVFFGCLIFHEDTLTPRTGSASTNSGAKRSPLGRPITTSCWWTSTNSSRPSGAKERRRLAFNAFSKRWPSQKSCLDLSPVVELNGPFLFFSFRFCFLCWLKTGGIAGGEPVPRTGGPFELDGLGPRPGQDVGGLVLEQSQELALRNRTTTAQLCRSQRSQGGVRFRFFLRAFRLFLLGRPVSILFQISRYFE